MLMEEFEERTGFHVPGEFFDVIHEVYMETDMDKDKFCNAYKKNKDGLAEKIKMQYIRKRTKEQVSICKKLEKEQSKVNQLESQVEHLKKDLEREQEWAPFVDEKAVSNEQYDQLTTFGEPISDEDAKKIVSEYFGFDENKHTQKEIANILGISQSTTSRLIVQILAKIRIKIEDLYLKEDFIKKFITN